MKKICFFTNGHNGDIIHSKTFIQDITNQLNVPCFYHHKNNHKVSQDISTTVTQIYPGDYYVKFFELKNILFINTWLWPYMYDGSYSEVNIKTNYQIFDNIYKKINEFLGTNIQLKNIEEYLPTIDFDIVEKNNIDKFIEKHLNKKILFCNSSCLSGQTSYNDDMSDFILRLSNEYPNMNFIATKKFESQRKNIYFTDDIIKINGCDLNEIGYLSTFCDLIIGRNSGPFCFSTIKQNYNNPKKIFYAFGHNQSDCFHGNVKVNCEFIFNSSENKEMICNSINQIINQML
jgi:hypothetical protein